MNDEIMAHLRALGVALAAAFATHPQPEKLREAFDQMAETARDPHPTYQATIDTLRKAIT
jgi:hypothetical protein